MASEENTDSSSVGLTFASSVRVVQYAYRIKRQCLNRAPLERRRSLAEYIGKKLGGNFSFEPENLLNEDGHCSLSPATQRLLKERVFHDLDPRDIVDYHCHIVGHDGGSGSQCFMHDSMKTWWYPLKRFKSVVFMSAAQVNTMNEEGDVQYISRLIRLVKHLVPANILDGSHGDNGSHGDSGYLNAKHCMLPFDKFHNKETGESDLSRTTMYIPNEYSLCLSTEYPEFFMPVGSVNPYRRDACDTLQYLHENGVTIIKWLPNSMGINPSDRECEPFYRKMKELEMILLVHCGEEHAVDAAYIDNTLGNPLLLRMPLDMGVKVITAHCASEGNSMDTENGDIVVPSFDLWLRLMREDKYKDVLYGDISAICGFLRVPQLLRLLQATDVHDRLVYGSDYPVPAINMVVHTSKLQRFGLITAEEKASLDELYHYNPLLFDIASKRVLRGPQREAFPVGVFKTHPHLPPRRQVEQTPTPLENSGETEIN